MSDQQSVKDVASQMLVSLINEATSSAAAAKGFLAENIPEVLKEYLAWGEVRSGVYVALSLIAMFGSYRFWKWTMKVVEKDDVMTPLMMIAFLFSVVSLFFFIINLMTLLQILVAPKLYLLERAAELVK